MCTCTFYVLKNKNDIVNYVLLFLNSIMQLGIKIVNEHHPVFCMINIVKFLYLINFH